MFHWPAFRCCLSFPIPLCLSLPLRLTLVPYPVSVNSSRLSQFQARSQWQLLKHLLAIWRLQIACSLEPTPALFFVVCLYWPWPGEGRVSVAYTLSFICCNEYVVCSVNLIQKKTLNLFTDFLNYLFSDILKSQFSQLKYAHRRILYALILQISIYSINNKQTSYSSLHISLFRCAALLCLCVSAEFAVENSKMVSR